MAVTKLPLCLIAIALFGYEVLAQGIVFERNTEAYHFCADHFYDQEGKVYGAEGDFTLGDWNKFEECMDRYEQSWREPLRKKYDIDGLIINVTSWDRPYQYDCSFGGGHTLELDGPIGPDSSFAVRQILSGLTPCTNDEGVVLSRPTVILDSDGGSLLHGYTLGRTIRDLEADTLVNGGDTCASACAVAFLGGRSRMLRGQLLLHSPYTVQERNGRKYLNCDLSSDVLLELKLYYIEMMSDEASADRIFDRTLLDCSASEGWVLKGQDSAELFGVATPISRQATYSISPNYKEARRRNSRFRE